MTSPNEAFVAFEHVQKSYDGVSLVVKDLNLAIGKGEFLTMLGPSGSGKTTCLRLISGFETPTSGAIRIFGEDVSRTPPHLRNVNTVFQDYALFSHLNVRDNVAYGLMVKGVPRSERYRAAEEMLALVKLDAYGDRKPGQLSGGQRQRVALARALVNKPRVLLLDEPLGALDLKLREAMQDELKALQHRLGITFVFVTHDQHEALSMADSLAVFSEGKIAQIGTPSEVYTRPRSRFVADFVGSSNVLPPALTRALGGPEAWASLRPEATMLAESALKGPVTSLRYQGAATRVAVDLMGTEVAALVPSGAPLPEPGAQTGIAFAPGALHVMEAQE